MLLQYLPLISLLAGMSAAIPLTETSPSTLPRTFHDAELGNITVIASGTHIIPEGADMSTHAKRQNICSSIGTPDECCFDSRTTGWGWTQVTVNDGTSPNACIGYSLWPQEKCDKKWTDGDYDDIVSICDKLQQNPSGVFRGQKGTWWTGDYRTWSKGANGIDRYCGFLHLTLKTNRVLDSIGGPHNIYWHKDGAWTQYSHKSQVDWWCYLREGLIFG